MLPPDQVTLSERHIDGVYILVGRFVHGDNEHERNLAEYDHGMRCWIMYPATRRIVNYVLVVDSLNDMSGPMESLCYNCHGLKKVWVRVLNTRTKWAGGKTKDCPVCKALGILPRDTQEELFNESVSIDCRVTKVYLAKRWWRS